jgi:hypothetical protein
MNVQIAKAQIKSQTQLGNFKVFILNEQNQDQNFCVKTFKIVTVITFED